MLIVFHTHDFEFNAESFQEKLVDTVHFENMRDAFSPEPALLHDRDLVSDKEVVIDLLKVSVPLEFQHFLLNITELFLRISICHFL